MKKILLSAFIGALVLTSCGDKNKNGEGDGETMKELVAKPTPPKAEGPIRILFVGNSHTEYFASFPKMLDALAKENNKQVEVKSLLEMGVSIDQIISSNKKNAEKLFKQTDKDGNYLDYVILQESTPVAIQELGKYKSNTAEVHDQIAKNSPDVATYIYGLTVPFEYNSADYKDYQPLLVENGVAVAKALPNTGFLNFSAVLGAAYAGKEGYTATKDGKDMLRHTDRSRHMLNDAVFVNSIVLYQTLFGETPKIPQQLPLSTGLGDDDTIKLMDVKEGVSDPEALLKIATSFK
ncbi:hypothetical protein HX045_10430 [Myroides odoratimimus]|uniref:hypothetical protein n=1 Tax=Myroides TaxID=76831 RepID=UPI000245F949|nr:MULTISPECIES: hypothetical protein [Myroides]EHO05186.1 hypothetical protein HMPREF9714_03549 [Myroides odoratimimus CCUG 12901]MCA4792786.1 hypothetical protein [Myroides odoratimimus]MCA4820054.1 hypothetical protein [Myroides odoratimimus]MCS7472460.1 hypothetical protein [Myroides odoratimimus]MDM1057791.1 hypothetical protein [Myroides odoratimimus]